MKSPKVSTGSPKSMSQGSRFGKKARYNRSKIKKSIAVSITMDEFANIQKPAWMVEIFKKS